MQFTTTLAALFIASAAALPGTPVQERQATPTAYLRFFNGGGCQGNWVEDFVFPQNTNDCIPVDFTTPYGSFNVTSTTTRQLRLYNSVNCDESGQYITLPAGPSANGCYSQQVKSGKFL
ncbi:hypothetical protein BDV96DRAFT_690501 [Lophiotrema nucula]|uniref:Uncharacterized protein n=1 Tax=Lophiotrema nucula TaxID=690887 RepID=A0A6A5YVT2_9PLEO|nr:hypothetical protein BDV96DRAFT_690501 [Lophiotrema nucula]